MSKSDKFILNRVYIKWLNIEIHLRQQSRYNRFESSLRDFLIEEFT